MADNIGLYNSLREHDMLDETLVAIPVEVSDNAKAVLVKFMPQNVELGNPYHDEIGRFTTQAGNRTGLYFGGSATRIESAFSKTNDETAQKVSNVPDDIKIKVYNNPAKAIKDLGRFGATGVIAYQDGTVYVTPLGKSYLDKNPKVAQHAYAHESIHGRIRSNGKTIIPTERRQVKFEEGLTDLMAGAVRGSPRYITYSYANSVAALARQASGGDRAAAWKWVSDMHYNNDNPSLAPRLPAATDADKNWMFGEIPTHLEEEEEDVGPWIESEKAKWEIIYGIDFDGEDEEQQED